MTEWSGPAPLWRAPPEFPQLLHRDCRLAEGLGRLCLIPVSSHDGRYFQRFPYFDSIKLRVDQDARFTEEHISLSMSTMVRSDPPGLRVIMLHWLGGSARTWTEVSTGIALLGGRPIALDLPGFGHAAKENDFTIHTMVEKVILEVQKLRDGEEDLPWILAGHSMGGKVAACVARAAAEGRSGLQNLSGIVLVSPSPPGPEPMPESKRTEMLETLGKRTGTDWDTAAAAKFVDDNTGKVPLDAAIRARTVDDVLRSSAAAFVAWLTTGSKEDLAAHVATIRVPTVIIAGTEDAALGPDSQREHTLPHFAVVSLKVLEGCGHLAPVERPLDVVEQIAYFIIGKATARTSGVSN